jgi:hypothetical protein
MHLVRLTFIIKVSDAVHVVGYTIPILEESRTTLCSKQT